MKGPIIWHPLERNISFLFVFACLFFSLLLSAFSRFILTFLVYQHFFHPPFTVRIFLSAFSSIRIRHPHPPSSGIRSAFYRHPLMWSHHGNQTFRPPSNSTRLFLQISWDITYGSIHIMYECIFSISMSAFLSFWKYQRYSKVTWGDTRLQFFILGPFIRGKIRRVLHKTRLT